VHVAPHNTSARLSTLLRSPARAATLFIALLSLFAIVAPAVAHADTQLRGAAVHSLWSSAPLADSERELDMLAAAGANAIRLDISWSSLETDAKGGYSPWYVQKTDAILAKARSLNLKVVALLWSTPCWASSAPENLRQGCAGSWWDRDVDRYAPSNMNDFGDAVQYVTQRWGSQFAALEIWNEPNLPDQYSLHAADPAVTDAQLLKAAYPRAKAVAPNLPVLAGVLSGSDGDFLNRLYNAGIGGNFDGISIHPYTEWHAPTDPWSDQWKQWSLLKGVPWIRQIMVNHGDADKGIWLTEFGYSTCGNGDRWCVSPAQQAQYIKDTFAIASGWDYVKAALVYNLRNKGTDPAGREDQFGMLNRDFSAKPAWAAFQQAMADAGNAPQPATSQPATSQPGTSQPGTTQPVVAPTGTVTAPSVSAPGPVVVTPGGIAPVPLTCPVTASSCAGTVTIETQPVRATKRSKKHRLRLGSRRVRIARGKTAVVNIRIPARHRPLLRRLKTVRVNVTVSAYQQVGIARAGKRSALTLQTDRIAAR
jgi:polysaccharide biosynthesis protein PslG